LKEPGSNPLDVPGVAAMEARVTNGLMDMSDLVAILVESEAEKAA
jgi:hypothetical protein